MSGPRRGAAQHIATEGGMKRVGDALRLSEPREWLFSVTTRTADHPFPSTWSQMRELLQFAPIH
jgi:hypothetical protein